MKTKDVTLDEIIAKYKEKYKWELKEKGALTPEEKEKYICLASIDKLNKEIREIKPLVMGGYPKMMYNALTPFYQIIASIFILVGGILLFTSILGFFVPAFIKMTGFILPSTLSMVFGIIIFFFLKTLKSKVRR